MAYALISSIWNGISEQPMSALQYGHFVSRVQRPLFSVMGHHSIDIIFRLNLDPVGHHSIECGSEESRALRLP